jgi:hypothetical protein
MKRGIRMKTVKKGCVCKVLSEEQIKEYLLWDPSLRLCPGPERMIQVQAMSLIFTFFRDFNLTHPHFPQSINARSLEQAYLKKGSKEQKNFNGIVKVVKDGIGKFAPEQHRVLINAVKQHGSLLLAYLLGAKSCSCKAYAVNFLASQCLILGFSDITEEDYRKLLNEIIKESEGFNEK